MRWRSAYTYAWDLAERGVAESVREIAGLGLNTVTMAGSYHAGKFLRPRAGGKVYFPEDGTVYFRHDASCYGPVAPVANTILDERDILAELIADGSLAVNVWLVLLHNTLLGDRHPECCVRNAFGDRYIHSLCPSHPAARAYAVGLAKDVSQRYPIAGLSMESPGFAPFVHGFHHEFNFVRSNRWIEGLFGLCFCESCEARARAAGIDTPPLRRRVASDLNAYLEGGCDYPADMAESFWLADIACDGELNEFMRWRCQTVTSLVAEIRAAVPASVRLAVIPSVARPTGNCWYEGTDLRALSRDGHIIEACFYEPSVARVAADLADIRRRLQGSGALRGILRPSWPDLETEAEVADAVSLLDAGGVEGISFYNWGFLRERNLGFIAAALAGVSE